MTYDETTLFWRFLDDKGMKRNYMFFYDNHRYEDMDVDAYLEQADAKDAILGAFDIGAAPNSIFTVKFWQQLNEKWTRKLEEFRQNGEMISEMKIQCGHCGRMMPRSAFAYNPKGQLHKHCRECESGAWDRARKEQEAAEKERQRQETEMRVLEKEIAEKQAKLERLAAGQQAARDAAEADSKAREQAALEKTTKVCGHCGKRKLRTEFDESGTSPDGLQSWCRHCQTAAENVSLDTDARDERRRRIEEMKAPVTEGEKARAEQETEVKTAPRLGEHDATLHYKDGGKCVVFNAVLSQQVQAAGLTKCYLSTERDGRQFLVFNDSEGANVTLAGTGSRSPSLSRVNSVSICRQIAERFRLVYGDLYYLHITKNLSKLKDTINVEVKQVHTREEYAAIADRREKESGKEQPVPGVDVPEWQVPEPQETAAPLIDFNGTDEPEQEARKKIPAASGLPGLERITPDQPSGIPLTGRKPDEILSQLIERGLLTEQDIASFLYNRGWKLQMPVTVTTHKKFKA